MNEFNNDAAPAVAPTAADAEYAMLLDATVRGRGQAEYLRGVSPAQAVPVLNQFIGIKDEQIALLSGYLGVPAPRTQPVYVQSTRALVISEIAQLERIQNAYDGAELPAARLMLNQLLRLQVRGLVSLISLL